MMWNTRYGHMVGGGMMGGGMMGYYLTGLGLSKDQKKQVRSVQRSQRKSHFNSMENMMEYRDDLLDQYDSEMLDAKKIISVYDKMFSEKKNMIKASIESRNAIMNILTAEQRKLLSNRKTGMMGEAMMQ